MKSHLSSKASGVRPAIFAILNRRRFEDLATIIVPHDYPF
jgi:hypothetical protein